MKPTKYQLAAIRSLKERAYELYTQGMTTRQIGKEIGKSHTWAANAINELEAEVTVAGYVGTLKAIKE
jgi:hypothetical protein